MTGASVWMLISIHDSSKSKVKCLNMWVSRNLTWIMWMMNVDRHLMILWKLWEFDGLCLLLKLKFILEFLKIDW